MRSLGSLDKIGILHSLHNLHSLGGLGKMEILPYFARPPPFTYVKNLAKCIIWQSTKTWQSKGTK